MSAPMHTARRTASTGKRLPWWSVVLPVVAFVVLLTLMTGPGQAHAVGATSEAPGIAYLLERVLDALSL
ncbi:hypothetical protein ACH4SP_18965 [Streptomyces sp. NPDC021093]|uniref:hypothetical protein n=1 Tax=Streptomyces sp. NPDC021093 TaxID=3365112 RepID=UPI0037AA7D4B